MAPKFPRFFRFARGKRANVVSEEEPVPDNDAYPSLQEATPLLSASTSHPETADDGSLRPNGTFDSQLQQANGDLEDDSGDNNAPNISSSILNFSRSLRQLSRRISHIVAEHVGSIGYLGSFAICCNSLTGPAMLQLPAAYAESGFFPTTFTLLFVCFLSAFCSLHMANSISKVPFSRNEDLNSRKEDEEQTSSRNSPQLMYNHDFEREMEFSSVFSYYWGRRPWFYITHFLFWFCITCLNTTSIVDTAQVVDTILGHSTGSVAFMVNPNLSSGWVSWNALECDDDDLGRGLCLPFANQLNDGIPSLLLTAGTLVTNLCFFPLAVMDLKENAAWQVGAFLVLLVTSLYFVIQFVMTLSGLETLDETLPNATTVPLRAQEGILDDDNDGLGADFWWGHGWSDLFGVVLFNFALVLAVPAWLYERDPHVDVPTVIYGSSFVSTFLYISVGAFGRLAVPHVSRNMLASLMSGVYGVMMQVVACVFAFFIVGLGIPLFSVLTRLNLIGSASQDEPPLCSRPVANILAVYFPFGISWLLYDGRAVTNLLSWGGTICTSLVVFILPLLLALNVVKNSDAPGAIKVYGVPWLESTQGQKSSLFILLALAGFSIVFALFGHTIAVSRIGGF